MTKMVNFHQSIAFISLYITFFFYIHINDTLILSFNPSCTEALKYCMYKVCTTNQAYS